MIQKKINLQPFNTFGISAEAALFASITDLNQIPALLPEKGQSPALVLGGGSNILIKNNINGLVLHNAIRFTEILKNDKLEAIVKVGGGVNWHEFVLWTLQQGFGGVENLSLIPGTVGASPIQNIGAYGVELKDVFVELEALSWETQKTVTFNREECIFAYRDSFFKKEANKGKFFITAVTFRLTKQQHIIRTDYGAIQEKLAKHKIKNPSPAQVSAAVISIRRSKLPDHTILGNSGSFFKNPIVSSTIADQILSEHPKAPHYQLANGQVKIPAGWLIEQCGWKGKKEGQVGCFSKQALVIINTGGASGDEIYDFSEKILQSVKDRFGILIEREVNVV